MAGSFDLKGVPFASLVDVHSRGVDSDWMSKRAAVLTREISEVRPEPGYSFIHLVSMGAQEFYGANRNGDGFNEKPASYRIPYHKNNGGQPRVIQLTRGLVHTHPSFSKYAHVFEHHVNKDPALRLGDILADAYNHDMHRGELLIKVSNDRFGDADLQKLANNGEVPFSMSIKVPYDICSYCGNEAPSRDSYCEHLKHAMCELTKEGHQIFAINDDGVFFDISKVFRPADRIAYSLQKVASGPVTSGAELAEIFGVSSPSDVIPQGAPRVLREKMAVMKRMAAMEKQIEATGRAFDGSLDLGADTGDVPAEQMDTLGHAEAGGLMNALANAQICLPVKDFFRLVLGDRFDSVSGEMDTVKSILPGIFGRTMANGVEDVAGDSAYDPASEALPSPIRHAVEHLEPDFSFGEGPVKRRVTIRILRGHKLPGQPPQGSKKVIKLASDNEKAAVLAKEYARYQLAFARASGGNDLSCGLTVRRNYL